MSFNEELIDLLIKHNKDSETNVPNSILAEHIENYLNILTTTLNKRDKWNKITISVEDYEYLMEILNNPPEPSEKLKNLFNKNK